MAHPQILRICGHQLVLLAMVAPSTADAGCPLPKPPPSFCGDAECGSVICLTGDNSWDCSFKVAGTACTGGVCDGAGTCTTSPAPRAYNDGKCGCINANWNAPRGSLVLINTPNSAVKQIVTALGEVNTHEMISLGLQSAAQSEYRQPTMVSSCSYPIDITSLRYGFPGMEKSISAGAIYADIYGGRTIPFEETGSQYVHWQLGDTTRAAAIAAALDAQPTTDVAVGPYGEVIHRILWHGATSPYGLYQFYNIGGTYQGATGVSTDNTTVSSTFCAWAYAGGGSAMTPYAYGHAESWAASQNLLNYTYNQCVGQLPWAIKTAPAAILDIFGCSPSEVCNNAANMVLNCTALGSNSCGSNQASLWYAVLSPSIAHATSISPDRLGGLTRFLNEQPRPTTWASDSQHSITWSAAGEVCGCFE